MSCSSQLRMGDLDLLLAFLGEARSAEPGEGMPWDVLAGLLELIHCDDGVQYQEIDVAHERNPVCQDLTGDGTHDLWDARRLDPAFVEQVEGDELERRTWQQWWADPMCSYPQRSGDRRSVFHTGDFFPTTHDLLNRPAVHDQSGHPKAVMIVQLPAPPGFERRLAFARRSDGGFTDRDRQIVELLRPHLQEIWLDAERRRAGVPALTPREWEVLELTAAGCSHAEVAARLFLSVGTVRKHMEHVRERLGVHSATAAAALAMPHRPVRQGRLPR
jgi:DNA-binding CsgD family transcriptional regulator